MHQTLILQTSLEVLARTSRWMPKIHLWKMRQGKTNYSTWRFAHFAANAVSKWSFWLLSTKIENRWFAASANGCRSWKWLDHGLHLFGGMNLNWEKAPNSPEVPLIFSRKEIETEGTAAQCNNSFPILWWPTAWMKIEREEKTRGTQLKNVS